MNNRIAAVLFALVTATSVFAQAPAGFTRVLFPIVSYDEIRGANGSRWRTELAVVNIGTEPAQLAAPHACINCATGGGRSLRPNLTYDIVPIEGRDGIPGAFLFIDEDQAENVRVGINVRDVSRQEDNLGVQIPVVRENEFRERIELLRIPRDARYRYHLRIYSLQSGDVTVRTFEESSAIPNAETGVPDDLQLGVSTLNLRNTARQFVTSYPSFGEITTIPGLSGGDDGDDDDFVRIDVTAGPGMRVWAFLTITNNVSQEVTVVSPN
jgi:hypothetical protein